MDGPFKERDWKYMGRIQKELLDELCSRINERAASIASGTEGTAHERYLALYRYIHEADEIVAECFNDWRRSRLGVRILALRRNGLLTDQQVEHLSPDAREWLREAEEFERR